MARNHLQGSELRVLTAPYDVVLGPHVVKPDVPFARRADFTAKDLPVPPLLVIEILSPSTRHRDRGRKRDLYAEAGVPHDWIVDPDAPSIIVHELRDGAYTETAHAGGQMSLTGGQPLTVTDPVALTLTPAELLRD